MKNVHYFLFLMIMISNIILNNSDPCNSLKSAYQALDCFDLSPTATTFEKCCYLEYKSKEKDRKFSACIDITLEEFLKINKKIKDLEKANKDITITSLECDKSFNLFSSKFLFIFILLLR